MEVNLRHSWVLILLAGCGRFEERSEDGLRVLERSGRTDRNGLRSMKIPVEAGDDRMLVTARVDGLSRVLVTRLEAPDGERVYDADEIWEGARSVTGAIFPDWATTLNYPILPADRPLEPGDWEVQFGVIDAENFYDSGVALDATVLLTGGRDLDQGTLRVNLIPGGQVAEDPASAAAIDGAVEEWRRLYAPLGLTLDTSPGSIAPGELYGPGMGDREAWEELSADTPLRSVNVVFLETMTDGELFYGLTGSIPGPLVPSINSGVAVNMLVSSGVDGAFQPDEVRLLGETLAHEVGHFLGLFHPVELDYATYDSLDDTPECSSSSACLSELGTNLMYPEPSCNGSTCAPQPDLTDDQGWVLRSYTGVE